MIRTQITEHGQPYLDKPVFATPVKLMGRLASAMAEIHGHVKTVRTDRGFKRVRTDLPAKILLRYDRTYLRWMRPDGNGGLVPR